MLSEDETEKKLQQKVREIKEYLILQEAFDINMNALFLISIIDILRNINRTLQFIQMKN